MKFKGIVVLGALLVAPTLAAAQAFPTKPVRLVIPYPPGQGADIFGRMIGDELSKKWGQPVVADNRAGGGGMPGILSMKSAPPDGYTLVVGGSQAITVNPNVYAKMPYDPQKDLQPISGLYIAPLVWVVHPSSGMTTLADLVNEARKNPGKLNYASAGVATSQHMTAELFRYVAKLDMQHVAYKGSGPAMVDLLGGQVTIMMDGVASALPHVNGGKLRALAVTTAQRTPQLPNVPTIAESGYPGFLGVGWAGLFMPVGAPGALVEKISADVRAVLNDPEISKRIIDRGGIPDPLTPEQTAAFIKADTVRWGEVAKTANIRID
jgi:tripartite-type tricarboxylate transporter receptor subunit TctC